MLTDSKLKALKPKEKEYKVSDSGGLYVLIKPNGSKLWAFRYRYFGKQKKLSIGKYPTVSLLEARKKRDEAKAQLAEHKDPSAEKKASKLKAAIEADNTFKLVSERWHKNESKTWATSTAKWQQGLLDRDILPWLGQFPITAITTPMVVEVIDRIAESGRIETSRKATRTIKQIFSYAKGQGTITINHAIEAKRTDKSKAHVKHRAAITQPKAFGRLLAMLDTYQGSHITRTALKLAPLVFQRPKELCSMEWQELDLEAGLWVIPKEKKKERREGEQEDHSVPLSPQAIKLLIDIKPLTGNGKYVFPNQNSNQKHITTDTLAKALRNLGIDTKTEHTTHGYRSSARTMLDEQLHWRVDLIEHQLAHRVIDATGRAYNRTSFIPERRKMMTAWANYCDELKQQHLAGNVITANFK